MAERLPALHLYVMDYLAESRSLQNHLKGLYLDLLAYMHISSRRGYLQQANGKPYTLEKLVGMTGCANADEVSHQLQELVDAGVISMTADGIPFVPWIVAQERKRIESKSSGARGGNPDLGVNYNFPGHIYLMSRANGQVKIGASVNPRKRLYKIREQFQEKSIQLLASWPVADMGAEEEALHKQYAAHRVSGEWFNLPKETLSSLLKGNAKGALKGIVKGNLEDGTENESQGGREEGGSGEEEREALRQALAECFGLHPVTTDEVETLEALARVLYLKEASSADILTRRRRYERAWPNMVCHAASLVRWWDTFAPPPSKPTAAAPPQPEEDCSWNSPEEQRAWVHENVTRPFLEGKL